MKIYFNSIDQLCILFFSNPLKDKANAWPATEAPL